MTADTRKSKPSRSEIEDAVGGQNAAKKRSQKAAHSRPKPSGLQLETGDGNRRQQVIGGDLTGISRRRGQRGLLQRLSEINYVNLVAIVMVLAILAVFFWPTDSANVVREVNTEPTVEAPGYQGVERADEPVLTSDDTEDTFSRENDIERANEFRLEDTQQRQISLLLAAAQRHVQAGEYSLPPGNNAVSRFQQILQIDSSNRAALDGLEFIRDRYLTNGYQAIEEADIEGAQTILTRIEAMGGDSDQAAELSSAIEAWRTESQVAELLEKAEQAIAAENLILPARDNALYFYQQVTELQPDNEAAAAGIEKIADEFVNKANGAVLDGQLEAATGYLATVSVIDAKHPSIPMIESMIERAEPIAERRQQQQIERQTAERAETNSNSTSASREVETSTSLPKRPQRVSNERTPAAVAQEREQLDRQYLQRGLDAYYRGDYEEAAGLLQPLADRGIARAQFRLGYMYFLGRGFERDRQRADQVIRAALPAVQKFADEGRGWAQSDIGSLYEDGLVLPRDYSEAIYWYRSAAEQGYPGAQTNLGVMYARGRGVPASRKTAIEWFQRAAKQGDIAAIRNLETMGIKP